MNVIQLSKSFYKKNKHRTEILNKHCRPYLNILITIDAINFALPLRSTINPKMNKALCFKYTKIGLSGGVDFSKALIIEESDIENNNVVIDSYCFGFFIENAARIETSFINCLKKYQRGLIKNNNRLLGCYKYSTLQYYKEEVKAINFRQNK